MSPRGLSMPRPMPSKTPKQARLMAMCAHDPAHARGKCPPVAVAKEFNRADKVRGVLGVGKRYPVKRVK